MPDVKIFHNPQCGSSNSALAIIEASGKPFEVVQYLKTKPTREVLEGIIANLEDPVADLVRKDSFFEKLGLDAADYTTAETVIPLLVQHPRLLQRPIVVTPTKALIGRPKDRVTALLAD